LLSTIIGPTDGPQETDGGSGVYVTEFVADREAPPKSLTVQVQRGTIEDALPIPFTYVGGVCTSWRLQHEVGSFLRLEATSTSRPSRPTSPLAARLTPPMA